MLAYAPQAWTSDDTDAIERLAIQWGSSLAYPLSSIGAHVSAVPNHQVGRITPIATRAAVAFFGVFGYELDTTALSEAERAAVRDQVAFYREHRALLQRGRFVRLRSPFEGDGNETAWMVVSDDRRRAIVGFYRALNRPAPGVDRLPLRGLDPGARLPDLGLAGERRRGRRGPTRSPAVATICMPTGCFSTWSASKPQASATSGRACSCSRRSEEPAGPPRRPR